MGLDITVYMNIRNERACTEDDDNNGVPDNMTTFYIEPHFPLAAPDIPKNRVWSYSDSWAFRAGSYSGYNEWRDRLTTLAGFPKDWNERKNCTDLPFYELVWFSDCEGVIGPATCAKLAKDFEQWSSWAHGSGDDWFIRLYDEFKQAFKDAANNGAVEFH